MVGSTRHKLTLSSHPGKAIVHDKDREYVHEGHPVYFFRLGEADQAVNVEISTGYTDGQLIRIEGADQGFDCAKGEYHAGNEVVTWRHTKNGNQHFCVNSDNTVSPTYAQNRVWGLNEKDGLCLVEKDSEKKLIFENLPVAFTNRKTMKLAPSNFVMAGKALVASRVENHGHGMCQYVTLGSAKDENAIEVFVDGNQIVNANMFYSVLDGY